MLEADPGTGNVTVITVERTLALATAQRINKPASPEYLSEFESALWNLNRIPMGLSQKDVAVTQVPYSEDQMREFMGMQRFKRVSNPDFALFLPEVASTAPEGLLLLSKAYTQMRWEIQENIITEVRNVDERDNPIRLFDWFRTEQSIDAPYTHTNEAQAEEIIVGKSRIGPTLNIYATAGQESKLLSKTNQYLDEVRTWARILSSRVSGRVVDAGFHPGGGCVVGWGLGPDVVDGRLGVRSVGV